MPAIAPPVLAPGGPASPAQVLALQRSAGNQAVARMLAREPTAAPPAPPAAAPAGPAAAAAFSIEIPDEVFEAWKIEGGKASWVKGSLQPKGEVQFVQDNSGGGTPASTTVGPSTGSQGIKAEHEREGKTWVSDLARSAGLKDVTETLTFDAGAKKVELSVGVGGKVATKYDWAKGVVEGKAIGLSVEWEKLAETSAGAIELSAGLAGEGKVTLAGMAMIAKVKVVATGKVEVNWAKVATELGKRGAREAGKGALRSVGTEAGATVIAVDGAAVASAAAVVVVPLAAAAAMGYGMHQGIKNARAAREAAQAGVQARDQANAYAKGYAQVMVGGSGKGDGAAEAEAQLAKIVQDTGAPKEMVTAMVREQQGGYAGVREKNLKRIKDKLYADACTTFDESHKEDFSLIDEIGEDWGQRGVFRTNLRIVLFADDGG